MMVLYSGTTCPFSHSSRFVLFEKGCEFEVHDLDLYRKPLEISAMNPYGEVPILVERDLVLYDAQVINEYIDERFPHPQLMPPEPMARARARLFLKIFDREIFGHVRTLEDRSLTEEQYAQARAAIRDQLTVIGTRLTQSKFIMGDDFTMLDVALAPILWRLDHYGIDLPRTATPVMTYAERIFSRPAFIDSMTPSEKVMRR